MWVQTFIHRIQVPFISLVRYDPVHTVYGLARTLLAISTLLTILSNSSDVLFPQTISNTQIPISPLVELSLFKLLAHHIILAKLLAVIVLTLVIIGIYPRFTGVFHWYITFSFFSGCPVIDGGDHANAILTLLLIPLTLLDNRKYHWKKPNGSYSLIRNSVAWSFIILIRIQVAVLYLHAATAKTSVKEWLQGTATYYWFTHHYHGVAEWLKPLVVFLMSNPFVVTFISWSVILLEFSLFACLFLNPNDLRRKIFLILGVFFHFAIVLIHGLVSFYFVMVASLILYLSNFSKPYNFKQFYRNKLWKQSQLL